MSISTKKGDKGFTRTLSGDSVPKYHLVVEVGGAVDEANAQLGFARSVSKVKRTQRIIFQVQKHLFAIGAEVSTKPRGTPSKKKRIGKPELEWLERLVEQFEEALALPPGFVAFGQQEASSQLDVARTNIRKAERLVSKMNDEGLLDNEYVMKYLNRLSDLVFLLACYDEKSTSEKAVINRSILFTKLAEPVFVMMAFIGSLTILLLATVVVSLLLFHGNPTDQSATEHGNSMEQHMSGFTQSGK